MSSIEDELPTPPPLNVQKQQPMAKPRPLVVSQYKVGNFYGRKAVHPSEQQIYTQIPQNRSSSNRNSETTGTSEEELNVKSRIHVQPSTSTILNYPLEAEIQPKPAPLIFYKSTNSHIHPPVKARMVLIEDDAELSNRHLTMQDGKTKN